MIDELDEVFELRLEQSRARRPYGLAQRERVAHGGFAAAFVLAAGVLAVAAPAQTELSVPLGVGLTLAYAFASTIEFPSGAGYAVPAQLVFVPMLFLLPTPLVPALVALALALAAIWQAARGRQAWERSVLAIADAWFSLGPALVLVLADAQEAELRHWPVFVLALLAQFVCDFAVCTSSMRFAHAMPPRAMLAELATSYRFDALLAPVGLLAVVAAEVSSFAPLLLAPLLVLLAVFARERQKRVDESLALSHAYQGTALLLHEVLEHSDEYTGQHADDVVVLAVALADELGVDACTRRETELGALLHDVGKIVVPAHVLHKPGPLNEDEWAVIRTHTIVGERMLGRVGGLLGRVGRVVRASHERWDGGGYPDGLRGEEIPLAARIVTACDAYDAMVTSRPYRRAMPRVAALDELRDSAGTQLDPRVVQALVELVSQRCPVERSARRSAV